MHSFHSTDELLYFDDQQMLLDSSFSNIFALKDKTLFYSPDRSQQVLGIFRKRFVKNLSDLGLKAEVLNLNLDSLERYDHWLICNEVQHIMPVKKIVSTEKNIVYDVRPINAIKNRLNTLFRKQEKEIWQSKLFYL